MSNGAPQKLSKLPPEQKNRRLADLLRKIYNGEDLYADYDALSGLPQLPKGDRKAISDRYHHHLKLGQKSLREHNLLPSIRTQDRSEPIAPPLPIAVYLDQIRSAHNVGSILRTMEAFSLGKAYFSKQTPFIDHKQVQDASMGASLFVECHRQFSLDDLPRPFILLETSDDAVPLDKFIFPSSFTLVIGNEEYGCSDELLRKADTLVEIPLFGRKNSLNAANAFAIAAAAIRLDF